MLNTIKPVARALVIAVAVAAGAAALAQTGRGRAVGSRALDAAREEAAAWRKRAAALDAALAAAADARGALEKDRDRLRRDYADERRRHDGLKRVVARLDDERRALVETLDRADSAPRAAEPAPGRAAPRAAPTPRPSREEARQDAGRINALKAEVINLRRLNQRWELNVKQATARAAETDKLSAQAQAARALIEELKGQLAGHKKELEGHKRLAQEAQRAQQEKIEQLGRLAAQLEAKGKEFYLEVQALRDTRAQAQRLGHLVEGMVAERKLLEQEKADLKRRIALLEQDNAGVHREVGNAYMQGRLFDLAIESYSKALKLDSTNAEVHYRLGLLYQHARENARQAVAHFRRYLQLYPEAVNRKEVEYLIEMLSHQ